MFLDHRAPTFHVKAFMSVSMSVWEDGLARKYSLVVLQMGGGTQQTSSHTSVRVVCWDIHQSLSHLQWPHQTSNPSSQVYRDSVSPLHLNYIIPSVPGRQAFLCVAIPSTSLCLCVSLSVSPLPPPSHQKTSPLWFLLAVTESGNKAAPSPFPRTEPLRNGPASLLNRDEDNRPFHSKHIKEPWFQISSLGHFLDTLVP